MKGLWLPVGYNNVYFSDARSMARFGLMVQNGGYWGNVPVLPDAAYLHDMLNSSQDLNKSYGYLWWLNGKDSYMAPGLQFVFNGQLNPSAPPGVVAALGKNGQFLDISPSDGLIFVRMGNSPEGGLLVPWLLNDEIWKRISDLACSPNGVGELGFSKNVKIYPNPVGDILNIEMPDGVRDFTIEIFDQLGRRVFQVENLTKLNTADWKPGVYNFQVKWAGGAVARRVVKS